MFGTFGIAYIALASGLYHTFRDHNEKAFRTMLKLDYSGQVIMIFCVSISCRQHVFLRKMMFDVKAFDVKNLPCKKGTNSLFVSSPKLGVP